MAPRVLSTMRVRISRIGFDLAFTSIAQTPRAIGLRKAGVIADKLESEPEGEGERDLFVKAELDR